MAFRTGYFYYINPCRASIPVKPKFVLCMSAEYNLFYLINSCDDKRPYEYEKEDVVYIEKTNLNTLSHKSYINISKPRQIEPWDYENAKEKGFIANDLWLRIKNAASHNRKLGMKLKKIIAYSKK